MLLEDMLSVETLLATWEEDDIMEETRQEESSSSIEDVKSQLSCGRSLLGVRNEVKGRGGVYWKKG